MRNDDFPTHMVLAQATGSSDAQAAHEAAGQAVARLLGSEPDNGIEIVRGTEGPSVSVRRHGLACTLPVALSYAHSGGRAVAVAAPADWKVGIDLEPRGAVHDDMRRFFLTARERRALARVDATSAWCMKEAAWKIMQCTKSTPFHALEISPSGRFRLHGQEIDACVTLLRPWNGWVAALTWMRSGAVLTARSA